MKSFQAFKSHSYLFQPAIATAIHRRLVLSSFWFWAAIAIAFFAKIPPSYTQTPAENQTTNEVTNETTPAVSQPGLHEGTKKPQPPQQLAPIISPEKLPNRRPPTFETGISPAFQEYRLGPGDQIFIQVQRFPELSITTSVNPQGKIIMPLIGATRVEQLTTETVQQKIRQRLQEFIVNPQVSVEVLARRTVEVTITGEVTQPGFYPLSTPNLAAAIQAAGGATSEADLQRVIVQRQLPDGRTIKKEVDLLTPLQKGNSFPKLRLEDEDVIVLPEIPSDRRQEYDYQFATNTFLSAPQQPIGVTVIGEVAQPGFYNLAPNPRALVNAILTAGGVTTEANLKKVRVRRQQEDGSVTEFTVNLFAPLVEGNDLPEVRLIEGDAIVIPELQPEEYADYNSTLVAESNLAKQQIQVRVLSRPAGTAGVQTLPSGSTFANLLNNVPLQTADVDDIALIRFDKDTKETITRSIDGEKALQGHPEHDILLRENDVVIIGRSFINKVSNFLNTFTQPFRDVLGFLLFFDSLRNSTENLFGPSGQQENTNN
jgi:polysaccharide export outer membrane protein